MSKTNLAMVTATWVLWAGSHHFGIGEIVDVPLLAAGMFTIGRAIRDVASDL